jgi:hypothetical protein
MVVYYEAEERGLVINTLRLAFRLWQCFVVRRCTFICSRDHVIMVNRHLPVSSIIMAEFQPRGAVAHKLYSL